MQHESASTPRRRRRTSGQGLVEYALTIALVAVIAIGGTLALSGAVSGAFDDVSDAISNGLIPGEQTATPKPTKTPKATKTPKPTKSPKPTKPPKTPKPKKTPKP